MGNQAQGGVTIYILELKHGKYYVGKTRNPLPVERVLDHFEGDGSAWTREHPPVRVVATHANCSDFDEDKFTKEHMAEYGINNVRGGSYCKLDLDEATMQLLRREIRGASDVCLRCGREGHFVADCYAFENS